MTISEFIINDIGIQPLSVKIGVLKEMFDELIYTHIPIEKDGIYIGAISENDVRCFEKNKTVEDYRYALSPFFGRHDDELINILKLFANNDTNILPVLDRTHNSYLGYLDLTDIMFLLEKTPFFGEKGNIIVVEKGEFDYSFSEIGQIVESNDGKLYGLYISKLVNGVAQITVKTTEISVDRILQTFRRYGYKIISNHKEDTFIKDLKERSDYLNKYLNI